MKKADSAERICAQVLKTITPGRDERKKILGLAKLMQTRVQQEADKLGLHAEVRINGSVAKDTWLSEEADIDIFIKVPTTLKRDRFRNVSLEVARKAAGENESIERFAEHPYLEVKVEETLVNIVPCYDVKPGEWVSATDRTPYHTSYVTKHLNERLKGETRLLKKFMKGIGVYGAEIKIGGFSGYLSEVLILQYKSFINVLKSASEWKRSQIVDLENHYKDRLHEAKKLFNAPLIIVDPIDKGRNAAAAVTAIKLDAFIAASRAFTANPTIQFFYPTETKPFSSEEFVGRLKARETDLVFVKFGGVKAVPDILWGQMYRSLRALKNLLEQNDFDVIRTDTWSDETENGVFIFELKTRKLPLLKKRIGPPISSKEADVFLRKHTGASHTFSGPWVEDGRWMVEIRREYTDAISLLSKRIKHGGRDVGVARLPAKRIEKSFQIFVNEEILDFYSSNINFARFMTDYIIGRPRWLISEKL
ncbi:MAG TPA: CCA tRNA nucleotidyltransferase [archaeon]|nr:CCA tRNA nucleotidyltransferase [archaeon]